MKEKIMTLKADIFNALAHPLRLKILEKLRTGACCVCKIIPYVNGEQSNVSHHLAILRRANIVKSEKKGLEVWYKIVDPGVFELIDITDDLIINDLNRSHDFLQELTGKQR